MQLSVPTYDSARSSLQNIQNRQMSKTQQKRSPRGRSPSWKITCMPCKDHLTGTCTNPSCEKWHSPECSLHKSAEGCKFWDKCAFAHRRFEEQPSEGSKRSGDKSAVALLKETKNLGCVFQNVKPPRSSSILRKRSTTTKPIRCLSFTTAVLRNATLWDKKPVAQQNFP